MLGSGLFDCLASPEAGCHRKDSDQCDRKGAGKDEHVRSSAIRDQRISPRLHKFQLGAATLKCAALEYTRVVFAFAGGALNLGGRIIIPSQRFFAQATADNGDPGLRACVYKADHSPGITGESRNRFHRQSPSHKSAAGSFVNIERSRAGVLLER
jgi:hypothetical protein